MKSIAHVFAATFVFIAAAASAQELNLFNGRDLTGWEGDPHYWSVQDGAITGVLTEANVPARNCFLVWQGGDLRDFEFTCKYKLTPQNAQQTAGAGFLFRATYPDKDGVIFGYRACLDTGVSQPKSPAENGGLRDSAGKFLELNTAKAASTYRAGEWNDLRVAVQGGHLWVVVNGVVTANQPEKPPLYASGVLGLELHKYSGAHTIQFKDLKLRVFKGDLFKPEPKITSTAPSPAPAATTEPVINRLDELKEQGPNVSAWALAPLEIRVPPEIRQNVSLLREDLLDEAARAPKASAAAYQRGEKVCNALLNVLTERELTQAQAGYRAVEAAARIVVTSQSLEARRNHTMSWPQFAREKAERAELNREALNGAAKTAAQPKLQWAERVAVLHNSLDALYEDFRASLRSASTQR